MHEDDAFLLGTDLVKDPARLVAAYDDPQGVTAQFNKNVLAVLDRELGADFKPDDFEHRALWDAEREWIEMRLESVADQRVRVAALELDVEFEAGEQLRTEISAKFRREGVAASSPRPGLRLTTGGPTRRVTPRSRSRCPTDSQRRPGGRSRASSSLRTFARWIAVTARVGEDHGHIGPSG